MWFVDPHSHLLFLVNHESSNLHYKQPRSITDILIHAKVVHDNIQIELDEEACIQPDAKTLVDSLRGLVTLAQQSTISALCSLKFSLKLSENSSLITLMVIPVYVQ